MAPSEPAAPPRSWLRLLGRAAWVAVVVGLAWFYYAGAAEHARIVNVQRVRADQSGYQWDAVAVYENWHGRNPPHLIGERNRMPLYPGFLALFYRPGLSPDEFFEIGKRWNIRLSLVLLALLWAIVSRRLPPVAAANLTLAVAFGYFVFKAGYMQAELLFYFLVFATFVAFCALLQRQGRAEGLALGAGAGLLAALAQLTKAAMLPLAGIFLAVYTVREAFRLLRSWRLPEKNARRDAFARFGWRAAAAALLAACFLGVLYPYLSTSKRVFGRYFYNVNTTFYVWYDNWPEASVGTYVHGDGVGWPAMPAQDIPTPQSYWRSHTLGQILARLGGGFRMMARESYNLFWFMKYVVMYIVFAGLLIASNWRPFTALIRANAALSCFLLLYAAGYLLAIAFYSPIGTTTGRFLLAHIAPLLFVLSSFFARAPFRDTTWRLAGIPLTPAHFHLLASATLGLDVVFTVWPRLMSTFVGY